MRAKVKAEGFDVEILRYQRLSEKDIDEACFLTFFDIFFFLVANQVSSRFLSSILLSEGSL
jgi:hypothetical protein